VDIQQLNRKAIDCLSTHPRERELSDIGTVGLGLPAALDRSRAVVLNAPNLRGFDGIDIKALRHSARALPVYLEKEVNLLLHDLFKYSLPAKGIITCYIGTGFGNAVLIDGKLLAGHNGAAGELGHIPS